MRESSKKSKPDRTRAAVPVAVRPRFPVWLPAGLLLFVTMVLYWPATHCDFINLDDPESVTANLHVQGGLSWAGLKWAFYNTQQAAYWAPLMWLSHMLDCQLFGLNPWGHHLSNVLLHAVNTVLVFVVFQRLTGATWRSLLLATLFGWHPLRVESVAWVTERKDVLSTFFWLLTMWAYASYVRKAESEKFKAERDGRWPTLFLRSPSYWLALALFALGLMSKAMLVTLPFALLLLDYWPLRRLQPATFWRLLWEKIPFVVLAAGAGIVTFVVQKQGGAVIAVINLSLGARVANALISYCRYLGKFFWPTDLAVFYPHPGHWPSGEVLLAGLLLLGVSVLFFHLRQRHPCLLVGWLWFLGTLAPVIGLAQSGEQAMADRFTYVPCLGLLVLVIWGAYELTGHWRERTMILSGAGVAAAVLCMGLTWHQLGFWKNSETLARHALAVTKDNYFAYKMLGIALVAAGQTGEAVSQFQEAIRLKPNDANARYNLGTALQADGRTEEAVSAYREAVRLKPDYMEANNNLGAMLHAGGRLDEAITCYQAVLRSEPGSTFTRINLGNALAAKGQTDEAIQEFQEALRQQPDDAETCYNLGLALIKKGRTDEAIRQFQEVLRLKPDDTKAQKTLATMLALKAEADKDSSPEVSPLSPAR